MEETLANLPMTASRYPIEAKAAISQKHMWRLAKSWERKLESGKGERGVWTRRGRVGTSRRSGYISEDLVYLEMANGGCIYQDTEMGSIGQDAGSRNA